MGFKKIVSMYERIAHKPYWMIMYSSYGEDLGLLIDERLDRVSNPLDDRAYDIVSKEYHWQSKYYDPTR